MARAVFRRCAGVCALLPPFLWQFDVASGRLTMPFPERVSSRGWAYWLVIPPERRMVPKIKRFREWLLGEMERARLGESDATSGVHAGVAVEPEQMQS